MKALDSFGLMACASERPCKTTEALDRDGFAVVPGPVAALELPRLADAYDRVVREAGPGDIRHGSTTTRVNDLVNRGAEFDCIYVHPPLIETCCHVLMKPFKLSTMLARTLRSGATAQELHQDYPRDKSDWTMVGFILMIDEFRADNGATCFIPGSHHRSTAPANDAAQGSPFVACGSAGSMILYNGAVWHGHGRNETHSARRSIQGAFIRRDLTSGFNLASRMQPETLARIGPLARYLIFDDSFTGSRASTHVLPLGNRMVLP
jgi:hypothetical protein